MRWKREKNSDGKEKGKKRIISKYELLKAEKVFDK